jgi:hypothetical protein
MEMRHGMSSRERRIGERAAEEHRAAEDQQAHGIRA